MVSPGGKREPKVDLQLPQHFRHFSGGPLGSLLMGITGGNLWASTTGYQIEMEKKKRTYSKLRSTQTVFLLAEEPG